MDHGARGLPRPTTIGAKVVAGHACFLQPHDEIVLADLRVVVVREVAPVLRTQLAAEANHVKRVVVERLGLRYVVLVVPAQHLGLLSGQHGAHGERQVLNAVGAHVELQRLQARGSRLVVEVMDAVQVYLWHHAVAGLDMVQPAVVIVVPAGDDGLRFEV